MATLHAAWALVDVEATVAVMAVATAAATRTAGAITRAMTATVEVAEEDTVAAAGMAGNI